MDELRFDDRVVIVTGAGNGLGRRHALEFAQRGARVVVNDFGGGINGGDRGAGSVAQAVVDEIGALGGEAIANEDSVEFGERIVECALDNFGQVDVLVNNAGIIRNAPFHKMTVEDWSVTLKVHLDGTFRTTRSAWPYMMARKYGRVVMTSSMSGIYGMPTQANYCAAKLGIHGLTQCLAIEGCDSDIRVNTIAPVSASRLTEAFWSPELMQTVVPELVSPLVLQLGDEGCPVTGELFEVGGGLINRLRWERSRGARWDVRQGFSPEDVRAEWSAIEDFSESDHPDSAEASAKILIEHLERCKTDPLA